MFYLTTHSTHFYVRLYGYGHMVKYLSDSERANSLSSLCGLHFSINGKGFVYIGMGAICWGTGGGGHAPPPHTHTHTLCGRTEYPMSDVLPSPAHTFWDGKQIMDFNIYLRFTVNFTGLIRTTCSHSPPIFRYSEHVQLVQLYRMRGSEPQ